MRVVTGTMTGAAGSASTTTNRARADVEEAAAMSELADRARLVLAQVIRRQAQLSKDPGERAEREEALIELYHYLEQHAKSKEVQLFAHYQRAKFELEHADVPNLEGFESVDRAYSDEVAAMGVAFVPGCEMDIQRQHVKNTLAKWRLKMGTMSYLDGCKAYQEMFEYRRSNFGEGNRHTVMLAKKFGAHLMEQPDAGYRGYTELETMKEALKSLRHADAYVIDPKYKAREITPLIKQCLAYIAVLSGEKAEGRDDQEGVGLGFPPISSDDVDVAAALLSVPPPQ